MWAKLRGFPAWPAQVLSAYAGHQAPPRPRPQCVLVHFFGTYDLQWLESDKKVSPFHENFEQYSAACKQKARACASAVGLFSARADTSSCRSTRPRPTSRSSKRWPRRSTLWLRAAQLVGSSRRA